MRDNTAKEKRRARFRRGITVTNLYLSKEARDTALQTGMKNGMALCFNRLAEFVASMPAQPRG
jgi:hypothetical protein